MIDIIGHYIIGIYFASKTVLKLRKKLDYFLKRICFDNNINTLQKSPVETGQSACKVHEQGEFSQNS